jgi:hypothetical protein
MQAFLEHNDFTNKPMTRITHIIYNNKHNWIRKEENLKLKNKKKEN